MDPVTADPRGQIMTTTDVSATGRAGTDIPPEMPLPPVIHPPGDGPGGEPQIPPPPDPTPAPPPQVPDSAPQNPID